MHHCVDIILIEMSWVSFFSQFTIALCITDTGYSKNLYAYTSYSGICSKTKTYKGKDQENMSDICKRASVIPAEHNTIILTFIFQYCIHYQGMSVTEIFNLLILLCVNFNLDTMHIRTLHMYNL